MAPGYIALALDSPLSAALGLAAALATMIAVRGLSMITVLYGRRRFTVSVLTGFAFQWTMAKLVMGYDPALGRLDAVGFIIPGLIAH